MTIKRRLFIQGSLIGLAAGLLLPQRLLAAWPKSAFTSKDPTGGVSEVFGSSAAEESADIKIKAPAIAENAASVPVSVSTTLADVESIAVVASGNPTPLTSVFNLGKRTLPSISIRIKMAKTADLVVYVKAGGKLYSAKQEVKVTAGGCGG